MDWIVLKDDHERYRLRDRLKAGMMLRMDDGSELLVGDVNRQLGVCDCCTPNRGKDIVAYKEPAE
jgi:hypothetical protein